MFLYLGTFDRSMDSGENSYAFEGKHQRERVESLMIGRPFLRRDAGR